METEFADANMCLTNKSLKKAPGVPMFIVSFAGIMS